MNDIDIEELIPVVFRVCKTRTREVIALFPTEPGSMDPATCSSFMHIGQHAAMRYHVAIECTWPATKQDYTKLKAELEAEPYNYRLKVYIKSGQRHHDKRRTYLKQLEYSPTELKEEQYG